MIDPNPKPARFIGSAREDLRWFPEDVRTEFGYAIFAAQEGGKAPKAKPLKGIVPGAGVLEIVEDFEEGMAGADVVYAKAWGSMLTTSDHEESAKISEQYSDWIVDPRRMEMADEDAIYMHPLPADRNVEVADAVIDGRWSRVYDQAENRLHAQKAVMALTM